MSTPADWICGSCNHLNFHWRQACRRCKDPQPQDITLTYAPGPRVFTFRPGDWFCDVGICQAHNFASRRFCFKCGSLKSIPTFGPTPGYYAPIMTFSLHGRPPGARISRQGWKPGDWFCGRPDCYAHNYASRVICFKCKSSYGCVKDLIMVEPVSVLDVRDEHYGQLPNVNRYQPLPVAILVMRFGNGFPLAPQIGSAPPFS
ncbi:hypothetical protein L1887_19660 [Cichorium endivia]|nr:hypothetical protein L1887_19660 [Cichorium endivia]